MEMVSVAEDVRQISLYGFYRTPLDLISVEGLIESIPTVESFISKYISKY